MRGAATTRRRPTVSTEETVTSYMVLTSCLASKLVAHLTPQSSLCSHPPVSPPSVPSFLSASLCFSGLRHCVAGHCTKLSSVHTYTCSPPRHSLCTISRLVVYSFNQLSQKKIFFCIEELTLTDFDFIIMSTCTESLLYILSEICW